MKKDIRKELKKSFSFPKPEKKAAFLRTLNFPKETFAEFLRTQIGYIHKKGWLLSLLVVIGLFAGEKAGFIKVTHSTMLWIISAVLPLFALAVIAESGRSQRYGMAELEASAKYSLPDICLVRMGTMTGANLILFIILLAVIQPHAAYGLIQTGIFLFFPYLLTCFLTLYIQNRVNKRDCMWYCSAASMAVSILAVILPDKLSGFYATGHTALWMGLCLITVYAAGKQYLLMKRKMEDRSWSLYWID